MKFNLSLNRNSFRCSEGCCSDSWYEPELWTFDENGYWDECIFFSTYWRELLEEDEDNDKLVLEIFNKYHNLDLVLTVDNCIVTL
jgi:hypothetical protein